MLFRQLFDKTSSTYTYLLATYRGGQAVIVDPVQDNIDLYCRLIEELNLSLQYAMDTHTHADHITATGQLRQETGCQIAGGAQSKANSIDVKLEDGDDVVVGNLKLTAWYTPGHTDDSFCYVMPDRIFTGDTLLIRKTGRTDFQSGSAEQEYHSIFDKILTLPDDTLVYPGHDYDGMTVSSVWEEKKYNPRLQVTNVSEYKTIMNNLNLPKPKLIDEAVPANLKCGLTD